MEAGTKLERLERLERFDSVDRQQLENLLEEHHAALRMSVLSAFDRLCCPVPTLETDVSGPVHSPSSQPVEPSAADPLPLSDFWHKEAAVAGTATNGSSSDSEMPLPAVEGKRSVQLVPEEVATTRTLVSMPSQSILGLETIVSKTRRYIDLVAGFLVLSNSLVMMLELEMEGRAVGLQLGLGDGSAWVLEEVEPTFQGVDTAFVYVFLVELLFRILAEGRNFFFDAANWFDTVLVLVGLADIWIIVPVTTGGSTDPQNIVMMRLFRAVKCLRAIRMVRTFRLFRGLNLLVKACQCFLPSLGWSMVLLFVFMSMGTLIMGNLLRSFIEDPSNLFEDRVWVWNRYGTAYRAMYTLYEVTFAGNWPTNARPVLEKVSHAFVLFYLVYVTVIVFAVIRVISAIFLKDTLDAAHNDAENLVFDRLKKKASYVRKLQDIFKAIDNTSDGMVTEDKLSSVLANPTVAAYFHTLDVDVVDSATLFHLLDNGDGEMTMDEFVEGILRCKGPARAMDQVAIRAELGKLDTKVTKLTQKLKDAGLISPSTRTKQEEKAGTGTA